MSRPLGTPDDKRAGRIGHVKALQGLIANRDAIESSVTRVRKAANGYSDEELYRFARLIILSENAPSDWRQTQLKRIRKPRRRAGGNCDVDRPLLAADRD